MVKLAAIVKFPFHLGTIKTHDWWKEIHKTP